MKRKCTVALSPVRKQSLVIDRIVAVCLMLPQCTVGGERQTKDMSQFVLGSHSNSEQASLCVYLTHGLISRGDSRRVM